MIPVVRAKDVCRLMIPVVRAKDVCRLVIPVVRAKDVCRLMIDTCSTMRHDNGVYAPLNTYDMSFGFRKSISSADFGI